MYARHYDDGSVTIVTTAKPQRTVPLPDVATVIVTLNRATGLVAVDAEFSTPAETAIMLDYANDIAFDQMMTANGRELAGPDDA